MSFSPSAMPFGATAAEVDFEGRYYQVERGKLHTPLLAPGRSAPGIYISGHSERAEQLAIRQGSCLLRGWRTHRRTCRPRLRAREAHGLDVCLRFGIICRPTREEAVAVAESLMPDAELQREGSSSRRFAMIRKCTRRRRRRVGDPSWPAPWLWAGFGAVFRSGVDHDSGNAGGHRGSPACVQTYRRQSVHHVRLARSR